MATVHSYQELLSHIQDLKVPYRNNDEQQLLELPSNAQPPLVGNLILKWEKSLPFLQIVHFMAEDVPEGRAADVMNAIIRLDNMLEVGGFGYDHGSRRLYCRLTVPVFPPEGINWSTLDQLCAGVIRNCREFISAFKAVIDGQPGDKIVELHRDSKARA